jgi:hypothetical protein
MQFHDVILFVVTNVITWQLLNGFNMEDMRSMLSSCRWATNIRLSKSGQCLWRYSHSCQHHCGRMSKCHYHIIIHLPKPQIGFNRYHDNRNAFWTYRQWHPYVVCPVGLVIIEIRLVVLSSPWQHFNKTITINSNGKVPRHGGTNKWTKRLESLKEER